MSIKSSFAFNWL